jgi:hypothetical protein
VPRLRILGAILLVVAVLAIALPGTVAAQLPPTLTRCTVFIDGVPAAAGTIVEVSMDSTVRDTQATGQPGFADNVCIVTVGGAAGDIGSDLTFTVDGLPATETPDVAFSLAPQEVQLDATTDNCNPVAVDDLAVADIGIDWLDLTFTAPGEDPDGTGTCTAYELRMAGAPILDEGDWAAATIVALGFAPAAPGTMEYIELGGFSPDTEYCFAIKAVDDVGKWSDLSNSACGTTLPIDACNPVAIDDLAVTTVSPDSITLQWTARGEDPDGTGTCTAYDVRYATFPIIDEMAWDMATEAMGEPVPSAPGETEVFTVDGLDPDTEYCFAVKSIDDVDKMSDLSNSACGTTGPFSYGCPLEEGWNVLSTPIKCAPESDTLGEALEDPSLLDVAFKWNGAGQSWLPMFATTPVKPMEAYYVRLTGATVARWLPSEDHSGPPWLQLYAKWNLVGPAPAVGDNGQLIPMDLWEMLATVERTAQDMPGWTVAVSPPLNQEGWSVTPWSWFAPAQCNVCEGFFVYSLNTTPMGGYSTTPVFP